MLRGRSDRCWKLRSHSLSNSTETRQEETTMSDTIYLRNLHLNAAIGPDRWHRSGKEQPVVLSLRLTHNVVSAAAKDDVDMTLNYGILCKQVTQFVCGYQGKWALNECAYEVGKLAVTWAKQETWGELKDTKIDILLPKGALRVEGGLGIEVSMQAYRVTAQTLVVKELRVPCIIGVNDHEKVEKQMVVIDLRMTGVRREYLVMNGQSIVKAVAEVSQQGRNMLMAAGLRSLTQRAGRRGLCLRDYRSSGDVHREDSMCGLQRRARHCGRREAERTPVCRRSGRRNH